jgi:hypothetical protein
MAVPLKHDRSAHGTDADRSASDVVPVYRSDLQAWALEMGQRVLDRRWPWV